MSKPFSEELSNASEILAAVRAKDKEALHDILVRTPSVAEHDGTSIGPWPVAGRIDLKQVAANTLRNAEESSAEVALVELTRFFINRSYEFEQTSLIYGTNVREPFDLGYNWTIEPARESVLKWPSRDPFSLAHWTQTHQHHTCITFKGNHRWKTLKSESFAEDVPNLSRDFEDRERVILGILSLALGSPVAIGISGGRVRMPMTTWDGPHAGCGVLLGVNEISSPATINQLQDARALLCGLADLPRDKQTAVEFSLANYRRALVPIDPTQAAIAITVAIEGLLLANEPSETITQTMALRAAWFLASTPDERLRVFEQIVGVYAIRSDLVHTGGSKWGLDETVKPHRRTHKQRRIHEAAVRAAIVLYQDLAKKLILVGFPPWKKLILGFSVGGDS